MNKIGVMAVVAALLAFGPGYAADAAKAESDPRDLLEDAIGRLDRDASQTERLSFMEGRAAMAAIRGHGDPVLAAWTFWTMAGEPVLAALAEDTGKASTYDQLRQSRSRLLEPRLLAARFDLDATEADLLRGITAGTEQAGLYALAFVRGLREGLAVHEPARGRFHELGVMAGQMEVCGQTALSARIAARLGEEARSGHSAKGYQKLRSDFLAGAAKGFVDLGPGSTLGCALARDRVRLWGFTTPVAPESVGGGHPPPPPR